MKAYVCDACGVTITIPLAVRMKESGTGNAIGDHGELFVKKFINRRKIHLCDECFRGLFLIVQKEETKNE